MNVHKSSDPVDVLVREVNHFFKDKCGIQGAIIQIAVSGPYIIRLDSRAYDTLVSGQETENLNTLLGNVGFYNFEFGVRGCYIATRLVR